LPLQPDVLAASATCNREQPDRRYGIDGAMLFDLPVQSDRQPLQLVDREKALHLTPLATFAVIIFRLTANCRIADASATHWAPTPRPPVAVPPRLRFVGLDTVLPLMTATRRCSMSSRVTASTRFLPRRGMRCSRARPLSVLMVRGFLWATPPAKYISTNSQNVAALRARIFSAAGSAPWTTSPTMRLASARANSGVHGEPCFPIV